MSSVRVLAVAAFLSLGAGSWVGPGAGAWSQGQRQTVSTPASEKSESSMASEYDELVSVRRISERAIVVAVAGGPTANIVALKTSQGVVVVDTTTSPVLARAVRRRIDGEFGGTPVVAVINTHGHGDHAFGNQAFTGVPIIGHASAALDLAAQREKLAAQLAAIRAAVPRLEAQFAKLDGASEQAKRLRASLLYYKATLEGLGAGFTPTPPTMTFPDHTRLDVGDRHLALTFFGLAHSASDIVIHCPEEGLWMTGDLFTAGENPYVDSERVAALERWEATLDRIGSSAAATKAIVPGHGPCLSVDDLRKTREFVRAQRKLYAGRESGFSAFKVIHERAGVDEALEALRRFRSDHERYFVLHLEIDTYAYRLMDTGRLDEALKIFTVLAEFFPDDWQSFDSLGEVQLKLGQATPAAENFRKSLVLDPTNRNAIEKLKALRRE